VRQQQAASETEAERANHGSNSEQVRTQREWRVNDLAPPSFRPFKPHLGYLLLTLAMSKCLA
jgi:hypothetical protein